MGKKWINKITEGQEKKGSVGRLSKI